MALEEFEIIQYDLFDKKSEMDILREEMRNLSKSCDNVRRGVFARVTQQGKHILDMYEKIEQLEKELSLLKNNL